MMQRNQNLVIGLTTFNHEFLNISVSGLGCVGKNAVLVIYNDNPCKKLSRKTVRRLGFRGELHIINTDENIGNFRARIEIIKYVQKSKICAKWFMFANDDDIVLNTNIPDVADNNFAIMGNAVVIKSRLLDILRVMQNPMDFTIDGTDTVLVAPNASMAGTFVRYDFICEYCNHVYKIIDQISEIISDVPFAVPTDMIMWNGFIGYMRQTHPEMSPIYMNQTNYLMTKLNATIHATDEQCSGMMARVNAATEAAPRGDE